MQHYATALRSKDVAQRRAAVMELCRLGASVPLSSLETLIALLQDPDEMVREGATEALTNMAQVANDGQPRVVQELGGLLGHPEELVRIRAVGIIARVGPAAAPLVPLLIEALKANNRIFCRMAAEALLHIGAECAPALQLARSSPDAAVRLAAQWVLGRLQGGEPSNDSDTIVDSAKRPTVPTITVPPQGEQAEKTGAERRTAPRFDCSREVFYQVITRRTDDLWWKATIRDVSADGIGLVFHASVATGTRISIDLSEAHSSLERRRVAKVVHCAQTPDGWLAGCAWIGQLDDDELQLLRQATAAE